jgi:hypothetical protein
VIEGSSRTAVGDRGRARPPAVDPTIDKEYSVNTLEVPAESYAVTAFRRGLLVRHRDVSGKSGTGVVAEPTMFSSGWVAVAWLGNRPCVQLWPDLDWILEIHGHEGATEVRWLDEAPEDSTAETSQCHQFSPPAMSATMPASGLKGAIPSAR